MSRRSEGPMAALALAALLGACASEGEQRRAEVAEIAQAHARLLEENRRAEEELRRRHPVPELRDLGPGGSLILHEVELGGAPGRELLRVRYTWLNTSGASIGAALLRLELGDPASGASWSEERVLRLPFGLAFGPDSSYTDELRVPTAGLHLRPGWEWSIEVRPLH